MPLVGPQPASLCSQNAVQINTASRIVLITIRLSAREPDLLVTGRPKKIRKPTAASGAVGHHPRLTALSTIAVVAAAIVGIMWWFRPAITNRDGRCVPR